jgi:DNA-binding CsgD family transcriptional regulator
METKVNQKNDRKKLPAGILEGTEAFWYNGEKWVIHEGKVMRFTEAPVKIQNMIALAFLKDKKSRAYLEKIGYTAFSKAMDRWYKCVIGALDEMPDFIDGKFTPDAYNHTCTDYTCPHRGKFCSLEPGLKNYEVETVVALKRGKTIKETAADLFISEAGLKSRVEKLKEKLQAENMAQMIAKAVGLGI